MLCMPVHAELCLASKYPWLLVRQSFNLLDLELGPVAMGGGSPGRWHADAGLPGHEALRGNPQEAVGGALDLAVQFRACSASSRFRP